MNAVERVPSIKFTDNDTGNVYELDFCRESVKFAEARGFKQEDIAKILDGAPKDEFKAKKPKKKKDEEGDENGGGPLAGL